MDYNNKDVIIARATPIGKSALAIIRLSGSGLRGLTRNIVNCSDIQPNTIKLKKIDSTINNHTIDTCMVSFFASPKSFTGEDMIEITCHGNDFVVAKNKEEALKIVQEKSPELKMNDLKQDEDVLDTWFSSWLWPISVFDGIRNPKNSVPPKNPKSQNYPGRYMLS